MYKYALAIILFFMAHIAMAEPVVIMNPANGNTIDEKVLKRIFLGKEKKFPDGSETIPVNQVPDSETRQAFDKDILSRSTSQIVAYWSKLVFTGKGIPPKEVSNDAEMIELVKSNPSLIGYVDRASVTDAVKILEL